VRLAFKLLTKRPISAKEWKVGAVSAAIALATLAAYYWVAGQPAVPS
jgi:hypothetical protein